MLNRLIMDERIDNIVKNSKTIDKATWLYVFSWIRKSSALEYFKRNSCDPKLNPETGLFFWPYEPSDSNTGQAQDLKQNSSDTSSLTCSNNVLDAFEGSVLTELSSSGYVPLYLLNHLLMFWKIYVHCSYAEKCNVEFYTLQTIVQRKTSGNT